MNPNEFGSPRGFKTATFYNLRRNRMSDEWNEETIRPHLFTEVEVCDDGLSWKKRKLNGFRDRDGFPFLANGLNWKHMRLIPELTKRLMAPMELCGKWLDFGGAEGISLVTGCANDGDIHTSHDAFSIDDLNCHNHGCQGWRDTPDGELHTSFEVEQ